MYATDRWKVRIPASGFMKLLPGIVLALAGLAVSAWVYTSSMQGRNPAEIMGEPGSLSEYTEVFQLGGIAILGCFFWIFWRHRKATLYIEGDRLVLKKILGSRSIPLSSLDPACSKAYSDRRSGMNIGVICHPTGNPGERGFRLLGYNAKCPGEMLTLPDSHGQAYDMMIMKAEEFQSFLNSVAMFRH